jgi:hypothetical protein
MDTGSGSELICLADVPRERHEETRPSTRVFELNTANGPIVVDREIPMQCAPLWDNVVPLVLPSTPPVLTIGRRCMQEGYSFHWPSGQQPTLTTPDGETLVLEVDNFVPYLPEAPIGEEREPPAALPSPAAPGSEDEAEERDDPPVLMEEELEQLGYPEDFPEGADEEPAPEGRDLKAEALSLAHLMTHMPKNPHCEACQRAKITTKPARRLHREAGARPKEFGELITADHMVLRAPDAGALGELAALVIFDRGTGWIGCYPVPDKTADSAFGALSHFAGPMDQAQASATHFYSDNAPELGSAAEQLGWLHSTSTPGRPATNGVAERAVRAA